MGPAPAVRRNAAVAVLLASLGASSCASVGGAAVSGLAESLSAAILDAADPGIVQDGVPAYLLLMDAAVRSAPDNERGLAAAAQLYALYGIAFTTDPVRSAILTGKAREYGQRALCAADEAACGVDGLEYDGFVRAVDGLDEDSSAALYSYCIGSLAYIRAHSENWEALAKLPKIEHALAVLLRMPETANTGSVHTYLGVLNTLRPESLGGRPEEGRRHFERAIDLTGGRDLSAKVEFARNYARLVYDRELHDRLLNEVLAAPAQADGLTLLNTLAQADARQLLASADEYF